MKALSLNTNCKNVPLAGTQGSPAGTRGLSFQLFGLASSTLNGFRRVIMTPRWKAWNFSNARAPFFSHVAKEWTIAPFTHIFGSISPNPYMQRPEQLVWGQVRGGRVCLLRDVGEPETQQPFWRYLHNVTYSWTLKDDCLGLDIRPSLILLIWFLPLNYRSIYLIIGSVVLLKNKNENVSRPVSQETLVHKISGQTVVVDFMLTRLSACFLCQFGVS